MKLSHSEHDLAMGGVISLSEMKLKASPIAFKILSSAIYTDKIRAVVRELCTNALDSHIAAKQTKPFDIHLPTALEPWFEVQDYGLGLSDEDVHELYTVYFGSSKQETNDQTGAFGLGSKSPFCYTQAFTTQSVFDGKKRTYNIFIDERGVPSVALMDEVDAASDECNGVKVQFPVKTMDREAFVRKLESVLEFFPKDSYKTNLAINVHEYETSLQGKRGWRFTKRASGTDTARAIQGAIAYPITCVDALAQYASLINSTVDLDFPIGSLDLAPSREALDYTTHTINNIVARFEEIITDTGDRIIEELETCTTAYEAWMKLISIRYSSEMSLVDKVMERVTEHAFTFGKLSTVCAGKSAEHYNLELNTRTTDGQFVTIGKLHKNSLKVFSIGANAVDKKKHVSIQLIPYTKFVFNDVGCYAGQIYKEAIRERRGDWLGGALVFTPVSRKQMNEAYAEALAMLPSELVASLVKLSECGITYEKPTRSVKGMVTSGVYMVCPHAHGRDMSWSNVFVKNAIDHKTYAKTSAVTLLDQDLAEGKTVYGVELKFGTPVDKCMNPRNFFDNINTLYNQEVLSRSEVAVYGFNGQQYKLLLEKGTIKPFSEINAAVDSYLEAHEDELVEAACTGSMGNLVKRNGDIISVLHAFWCASWRPVDGTLMAKIFDKYGLTKIFNAKAATNSEAVSKYSIIENALGGFIASDKMKSIKEKAAQRTCMYAKLAKRANKLICNQFPMMYPYSLQFSQYHMPRECFKIVTKYLNEK